MTGKKRPGTKASRKAVPASPASKPGARKKARPLKKDEIWQLRLYVAGRTARAEEALRNLERICEEHLAGKYKLEVIDLIKNPTLARGDQILAVPTLVRHLPPPVKKIIGDLSDSDRVLVGLNLLPVRERS